jgi:hypothetical protein
MSAIFTVCWVVVLLDISTIAMVLVLNIVCFYQLSESGLR